MSPERKFKHPKQSKTYAEFFAPGEILAIKNQGEALIDPLQILTRFGIEPATDKIGRLVEILRTNNPGLNIMDSKEGPRMYARDIEELIRGSSVGIWEIALEVLPENTRNTFFHEFQIGLEHAYQQMAADDKIRREKVEKDWQKNSS